MTGPVGFGPAAAARASAYANHVDILIADGDGAAHAVDEAVQRKRAGKPFFAVPIIDDPRAIVTRRLAAQFFRAQTNFYRRYDYLKELSVSPIGPDRMPDDDYAAYPNIVRSKAEQLVLRDLLWLGNSLLVRSWAEYQRITETIDETPMYATRGIFVPKMIPGSESPGGSGEHVVIWAPESEASNLLLEAFALEDYHYPTYVVCKDPENAEDFALQAQFVGPDDGPALLERSAAIVLPDLSDPVPSLILAHCGVPLVIASTSGAEEYVDGAAVYYPWDSRSLRIATSAAIDLGPPRIRRDLPTDLDYERELEGTLPILPPTVPLASIGIPTKNRHEILPRAIDSAAAQTYPNIDLLVINDGGASVADIVARYPRARLVEHAVSTGVVARVNEAATESAGKYYIIIADDDYIFPDHVARCVYALERTGFAAARLMLIVTLLQPGDDGRYHIIGYLLHDRYAYDPTELLWANTVGQLVYRRSAMMELGLFEVGSGHAGDWDYFLKYALAGDLACIKAVTCNIDQRNDQTNMNDQGFDEWERGVRNVYNKYPVPGRPYIERHRAEVLGRVLDRDPNRLRPMVAPRPLEPPRLGDYGVFRRPG
jgi:glycosyltransferase involved in cell wall biosynthesis